MDWLAAHPEPFFLLGMFVISTIGGFIVWELRKLHTRIDKYSGEMDHHITEGAEVKRELGVIHTKVDMHIKNGHRHRE